MDNPQWLKYWRLSATSTLTHQNLFLLGLPPVNTTDYRTYTQKTPQSQGGLFRQGYKHITLLWDQMTFIQFKTLQYLVDSAITAGLIYATVTRDNGTKLLNDFVDISAVAQPVDWQVISNSRGTLYQNVTLTMTNITIINDPSTVL